ncbi:MAG: very short patch repair endonuclease [Anaerolineae bacterium]
MMTTAHRSWNMSRIRSRNTGPEKAVRSLLHRMGYRFRLHRRDLPGVPDIVLPKYHAVVLVHGCFWHRHPGCKYAYTPKTRVDFWQAKFAANVRRDAEVQALLSDLGWAVLIVWECELRDRARLSDRLRTFLDSL